MILVVKRVTEKQTKCHVNNFLLETEEEENDDELLNDNPCVSTGNKE